MPYSPFPVTEFSGLNLLLEPDESDIGPNGAIDLLNVALDRAGSVRSRDGYTQRFASSLTTGVRNLIPFYDEVNSRDQLFIASATKVEVITSAYSSVATKVLSINDYTGDAVTFGTPASAGRVYYTGESGGTNGLGRWDGTAFTAIANTPLARYVTVQSTDNRLVAGNVAGFTSRLQWSDSGAPETFGVNNFVDLTPGDGEQLHGVCSWREFVFGFKRTKFFVFGPTSTDGGGNPIFTPRPIAGVGSLNLGAALLAPSPNGVYFVGADGLYLTTGSTAQRIDSPFNAVFRGDTLPFYTGPSFTPANITALRFVNRRLYISVLVSSTYYTIVYDPAASEWVLWDLPAHNFVAWGTSGSQTTLFFATNTASVKLNEHGPSFTTDNGAAISSRYRSGFFNPLWVRKHGRWLTQPSMESKIRETVLHGIGSPTFSISRDYATALPTIGGGAKATVTLGTAPNYTQGRHRRAQRARVFSWQIEGTTPWRLDDLTFHIAGQRQPGLEDGNP